ncbi:MAG: ABC transporter ATP-binding protein [Bdellovibrionaceae bacterium]|nr:ABC transporter ATP-binding protein [Pseudobdellovibrionaceae bacterium]
MDSQPLIRIHQVQKSYRLGEVMIPALKGVDLNVAGGEFTVLIGASGSGKSTLLNLIGCVDEPDSGEIWFDGQAVAALNEKERSELRNRKIGFVFQSFNLIPVLSVAENIELPLLIQPELSAAERRQRVESALADVGLAEYRHHLPDRLSGGQRQRVAIARALVTQPKLILADEPTANLDSKTAHMIIDLLLDLNRKRNVTFFFCSHDEKLIGRVGRVLHIVDGLISA